jgi:SAM-dependent methyltransferase
MAEQSGYDPSAFEQLAPLEADSWWFRSRNRLIEETVRHHFAGTRSVLEIGCGTGYTLGALHDALPQAELTGTELFEQGLTVARGRWPDAQLQQADATALPFQSQFDLVGAFDVLEHIDDDHRALAEVHRVLRPGGGMIATVPQHTWLWSQADEYAHHERRYTRKRLISAVRGAGFEVRQVTSFVTLLLPVMAASRFASKLRRPSPEEFDPWAEFHIPGVVNRSFEALSAVERSLIRRGVSLPAGGSLLIVAMRR